MKNIVFIVEKTNTGYSAYAENYPAYTTGDNLAELKTNILNAINSWFEHKGEPEVSEADIKLQFDLPQLKSVELV